MRAGPIGDLAMQAGIHGVQAGDLLDRCHQLLAANRDRTWFPPRRGQLVDLPDCDLGRARAALNRAFDLEKHTVQQQLSSEAAEEVLAAYGIPNGGPLTPAAGSRHFLFEDDPMLGLVVRTQQSFARLLPLTDRDAVELVGAAGVIAARAEAAVEVLLRVGRLIDDQPDVARVEVTDPTSTRREAAVAMWTGKARHIDDDPFVRRLPSRAVRGSSLSKRGRPLL